jgi:hypothetical protein
MPDEDKNLPHSEHQRADHKADLTGCTQHTPPTWSGLKRD